MIAGATNINVEADDFKTRIAALDKNKTYFVYCRAGKRSTHAYDLMKEAGFSKVYNLEGGITEWKTAGLPVVKK